MPGTVFIHRRAEMNDIRLKVAGFLFLAIAALHLVRFLFKWEVTVAGAVVPINASVIGFLVAGLLAFWMLKPGSRHG